MLASYNRKYIFANAALDSAIGIVAANSKQKTGLEWNQYIGRTIINDFITLMEEKEKEGTDLSSFFVILTYIEYGLFQSAIKSLNSISITGLETEKEWLVNALTEAEDRYE